MDIVRIEIHSGYSHGADCLISTNIDIGWIFVEIFNEFVERYFSSNIISQNAVLGISSLFLIWETGTSKEVVLELIIMKSLVSKEYLNFFSILYHNHSLFYSSITFYQSFLC